MLRVTAIVFRFVRNLTKSEPRPKTFELLAEQLIEAEKMWIRCIQASSFQAEIRQLAIGGTNPMVQQLRLFIDADNIVRCEGRISQTSNTPSVETSLHGIDNTRKARSSPPRWNKGNSQLRQGEVLDSERSRSRQTSCDEMRNMQEISGKDVCYAQRTSSTLKLSE